MESNDHSGADQAVPPGPGLKQCAHCGGPAEVVVGYDPTRFGAHCRQCGVCVLPVYQDQDQAVALWNRRSGTISALGGKATGGKCSRRKLRAAKRNLKKGRQQKQLKRIRANIEIMAPQLRAARVAELSEAKERAAQSFARVQALMARYRSGLQPGGEAVPSADAT
jgi:hypothetical protein